MIFNEAAVQKSIDNFSEFVTSGKLQRQERDYKEKLIQVLGTALSREALDSDDFTTQLTEALNKIHPAIANLTHFIVAADFRKYVTLVSSDRLRWLFSNLFDESVSLAERFDAFDVEINADYDVLIEKGKRSGWLTALLLTVRFPEQCVCYRDSLVKLAQNVWDCDISVSGSRGQRYVAYMELVEQVRQRLSNDWQRPADMIDAHSFLWIAKGQSQKESDEPANKGPARVWKVSPGPDAQHWDLCRDRSCIVVAWLEQTDFRNFPDRKSAAEALNQAGEKPGRRARSCASLIRFRKAILLLPTRESIKLSASVRF